MAPASACGSSPRARGTLHQLLAVLAGGRFIPASAGNTGGFSGGRPGAAVHPRERGEHSSVVVGAPTRCGSSPRARGTRPRSPAYRPRRRFIPASAGNTRKRAPAPRGPAVHPRERGEHAPSSSTRSSSAGSSPRARGTHSNTAHQSNQLRFIPASAGNTRACRRCTPRPAVHPRERGEHSPAAHRLRTTSGSSPRARGTRARDALHPAGDRFIPASAGNTRCRRPAGPLGPVHPRERGEHAVEETQWHRVTGSSPRARGTRDGLHKFLADPRFIPASAGNTPCPTSTSARMAVHPRERGEHIMDNITINGLTGSSPRARGTPTKNSCTTRPALVHPRERGEHKLTWDKTATPDGSSPRARGTHPQRNVPVVPVRFIPASAGNTTIRFIAQLSWPVHPRERGEHIVHVDTCSPDFGSSPRARGTHRPSGFISGATRFIPASAGNTGRSRRRSPRRPVHPRERGEH